MSGVEKVLPVAVSVAVVAVLWFGLRRAWAFPLVLVGAFAAWAALVALQFLIRRLS